MAQLNPDTMKGIAIGLGAALLTPLALTALVTVGRPALRAAIKAGLTLYEQGREKLAEAGELWEDLIAEAQAELEEERAAAVSAVAGAPNEGAPEVHEARMDGGPAT